MNAETQRSAVSSLPFLGSTFLGAVLIFLVQPMFAKMATPLLGGSPSVWNVSLVCFQAALLIGYAYAHGLARLRSVRLQISIHAGLFLVGVVCLPLSITGLLGVPDSDHPALWLIGAFIVSIALPYGIVSATAPLIQSWYARSGRSDASDPYYLYAASNVGSLLGLAAYPLLLEPLTLVETQSLTWAIGYGLLFLFIIGSGGLVAGRAPSPPAAEQIKDKAPLAWRERGRWILLAFVPSSLLVGVTTHITTDLAAAPFLWVPPLTLYLLSFVFVFSKRSPLPDKLMLTLAPASILGMLFTFPRVFTSGFFVEIGIALAGLFVLAMVFHGMLVERRPHVSRLTEFYLLMSLGGVLGGAFNALLAPVVFDTVLEYPLVLILAMCLLPLSGGKGWLRTGLAIAAVVSCVTIVLFMRPFKGSSAALMVTMLIAAPLVAVFLVRAQRWAMAMCLGASVLCASLIDPLTKGPSSRNFFGLLRVVELNENRVMLHGTTLHGAQSLDADRALEPLSYYAPETPIGQIFEAFTPDAERVGAVGLGVGSVACYAQADQSWVFFEIDPAVVELATNSEHFTFMSSCKPDARIVLGDARLTLDNEADNTFDILLLDAFSSGAIPVHLITREAIQMYMRKLSEDGVLVFHISNRYMNLAPVFARVAEAEGIHILHQAYNPDAEASDRGVNATHAIILTRSEDARDRVMALGEWHEPVSDDGRIWTDDYSNIVGAIWSKYR